MYPIIEQYQDGYSETWNNDEGVFHRVDGPAFIKYYGEQQKHVEQWYFNGKFHRLGGPAYQSWYPDGQKLHEEWYADDCVHRIDGPAYQAWYKDGTMTVVDWYINGVHKTYEILNWIKENNIQLDKNSCIIKKSDKMLFRLRWC